LILREAKIRLYTTADRKPRIATKETSDGMFAGRAEQAETRKETARLRVEIADGFEKVQQSNDRFSSEFAAFEKRSVEAGKRGCEELRETRESLECEIKALSATGLRDTAAAHAEQWIQEAMDIMIRKECQDVVVAAESQKNFVRWMESYYQNLSARFAAAIDEEAASCGRDAREVIGKHVEKSKADLLIAADGDPSGFVDRVRATAADWMKRTDGSTASAARFRLLGILLRREA